MDTEVMERIPRYSAKIKSHEKITYLEDDNFRAPKGSHIRNVLKV